MTEHPNILFLMTDQQQARTVFPGAVCRTPNLDAIEREGVCFTRAYTPNTICCPVRASLLTGVLPHTHGMHDNTHVVDELRSKFDASLATWPQRLVDEGYQTAYFGKWHVERSERLESFGFQDYDLIGESYAEHRRSQDLPRSYVLTSHKSMGGRGYRDAVLYGVTDEPVEASRPAFIYSQAIDYLQQRAAPDKPWCLFVSTPEPHDPYIAHRSFYNLYDPEEIPEPINWRDSMADKPNVLKRMQTVFQDMTWPEFAEAIRCYYASCSLIDDQIGRLVDVVKARDEWEDTIVVFLADHGDMMGGHGLFCKGISPYEEVHNVPLILRVPGMHEAGSTCQRVVESCGIGSTLLDLVGAEPLPGQHFRSLTPLLRDARDPDWEDVAYAECHGSRYSVTQRIVWQGDQKLVMNAFDYDELYDLSNDPGELHNLAGQPRYAELKERLLRRIWRFVEETGDYTLGNAYYWSCRFFELGPNCDQAEAD